MSTQIRIIETGEIKALNILDPKTGLDWSGDLLGNYDACSEHDGENWMMPKESYDWWERVMAEYEDADYAVEDYRKSLVDDREFYGIIAQATDCDLEDMPRAMMEAIALHQKNNKAELSLV